LRFRSHRLIAALKGMFPLSRQAGIVSAVVPPSKRFRFALTASRWHGRISEWRGRHAALTEALMRDHWLRELTLRGSFPIPWRLHGRDVLDRYIVPGPVLYYTMHLPLVEIPLRVVMELGYPVPVPVADPGRILAEDRYVVAGMAERIPAIPASGHVLTRMRTLLLQGTSVVCLADSEFGGALLANPLRLAARVHVPVILVWSELGNDDVIDVTFEPAPHPFCESEAAIKENLEYLRKIHGRLLRSVSIEDGAHLAGSSAPGADEEIGREVAGQSPTQDS
jgi:hypothetical protein